MGTDPLNSDSDKDGMKDGMEVENGKNPTKSSDSQGSDQIEFENPKEKGEVKSDTYEVEDVEMVSDNNGNKKLKISGKGLPNSYVTVYVYSEVPTILTIKTDEDGSWSYTLDKDLDDGDHQVFVAVTDSDGKITAKSEPFEFIKTAQAVSKVSDIPKIPISSVVDKKKNSFLTIVIVASIFSFILGLIIIGWQFKRQRKERELTESSGDQF